MKSERLGIQELLETAVLKRPKQAGTNVLASEASKNSKLTLTVNQMLDLRTIDT